MSEKKTYNVAGAFAAKSAYTPRVIRTIRALIAMTQDELAAEMAVNVATISRFESETNLLSDRAYMLLRQVAARYGVQVEIVNGNVRITAPLEMVEYE